MKYLGSDDSYHFRVLDKFDIEDEVERLDYMNFLKEKMIEYYKDKRRDKVIPYVVFQAQDEDTVITMYESGKVMFQGVSADVDAAMWGVQLENTKKRKKNRRKRI